MWRGPNSFSVKATTRLEASIHVVLHVHFKRCQSNKLSPSTTRLVYVQLLLVHAPSYLDFSFGSGLSKPELPWHHWWTPTPTDLKHSGHWELLHLVVTWNRRCRDMISSCSFLNFSSVFLLLNHKLIILQFDVYKKQLILFLPTTRSTTSSRWAQTNRSWGGRFKAAYFFLWTSWH